MSKKNKGITQMPNRQVPRTMPHPPIQEAPSSIDIAKRNVIQSMNSIGAMASGMLAQQVRYMGLDSVYEANVDHAIEIANMLVMKMNVITKEELDKVDVEMEDEDDETPFDSKGGAN